MNKKIVKNLLALGILAVLTMPAMALAQTTGIDVGLNEIDNEISLGNTDPRTTVARLINFAMLFLGIIAVVIILAGGFKWMTAGGNEDKVGEAQKLISAGVIGLIIVLSAWGIANFVLSRLLTATS